jgi:anion-transporting  ArsA/GET3 family ATPase
MLPDRNRMSVFEHKLIVVTGKGGVGKTTVAAALGLLGARRGLRTIVVEVGGQHRLPEIFGRAAAKPEIEVELERRLWSVSIDPRAALIEWMEGQLGGRLPARVLGSSNTFQYFVAAAPGAREVVTMGKIWDLTQHRRWATREPGYDLVVFDAPATGHALAMLRAPRTFSAIARVGPVAAQAEHVREALLNPASSSYVAVAQGTEMAVAETIELSSGLRRELGRDLHHVVVNAVLPRRFTPAELHALDRAADDLADATGALAGAAAGAARLAHWQAASQHRQIARLRRHLRGVVTLPFVFAPALDMASLHGFTDGLGKKL